ncbi:MAG: hypothetical protein HN580_19480 [Deltaproteobacteria bacterium]|nr:hypothetical protein [Deltaproteobacteria bacterium]
MRNVFNIKKVRYVEKIQKVIYQGKMKKRKDRKNFEVYSALDFIAAITQHISDKFSQLVRHYGILLEQVKRVESKSGTSGTYSRHR